MTKEECNREINEINEDGKTRTEKLTGRSEDQKVRSKHRNFCCSDLLNF
jgi:hypothetical protein